MQKIVLMALIAVGLTAQANPQHHRHDLYTLAHALEQTTEVFEDAVDRRFRRSPVNKWADRLADRAEDFFDEVQDRDFREMQEEYADMIRAYQRVAQAYGQCTAVPRDRYLVQLWQRITYIVREISGHMAPRPAPRQPVAPYPTVPRYPVQPAPRPYPGYGNPAPTPGYRYPSQYREPYPNRYPYYPNPGQRRDPGPRW